MFFLLFAPTPSCVSAPRSNPHPLPDYWNIYVETFNLKGQGTLQRLLEPLEDLDPLKLILDGWKSTEGRKQLSPLEVSRIGLELDNETGEDAKLQKLLADFIKIGQQKLFRYTMDSTSSEKFLAGTRDGDCNTLTHTLKAIATEYLGIPVVYKTSADVAFKGRFITPQAKTIDGETGNVNDGEFWQFENHYWVEHSSGQYDVLFGRMGINTSSWVAQSNTSDNPRMFVDKAISGTGISLPIAKRYTT